jgi:subtilase family serine protease
MRRKSIAIRTGVAFCALALALSPVLAMEAGASGGGWTPVAQGVNPATLPGVTPFGTTPSSTPEQVSFILDEQNKSQLEANVERGVSQQLSVSQFAQQYGQSQSNISALTSYLKKFGITSTVYTDNVDVSTTGTAGDYDAALSVQQDQYNVPAFRGYGGMQGRPAQTVHGPTTSPELPSQLASFVLAVLGLSNYEPFSSNAVQYDTNVSQPVHKSSNSCLALTGVPDACNTVKNFESNYGLSPLESNNAGAGQTIGIVTLAALDVGAPEYYWQNVVGLPSTGRSVTVLNIDGGPGAPSDNGGSGETDLDVEQSGGVAPGANVIVYQAPNTDPGFADAFYTAASQNVAGSVSSSWGESETIIAAAVAEGVETSAYIAAFDEAFLELAAQGQATFVSAGDSAAYDDSGYPLYSTNLSVDAPGDSPYVTSSGGTTLPWSGTLSGTVNGKTVTANVQVNQQRAWGWDYLWQPIATVSGTPLATVAESYVVGGGGGFSVDEPTPSYQQQIQGFGSYSAVQYLTPTGYNDSAGIPLPYDWNFNPTPSVSHGYSSGRAEPDLATDADPETGYLLYAPSFAQDGDPMLEGGWGGTSFVAPELNGSTAVIDASVGHRVGFWNPSIYSFATSRNSPFNPLQQAGTSNDNIFYTGNPGSVYNESTGLGIPNLAALAQDFGHSFGGLGH